MKLASITPEQVRRIDVLSSLMLQLHSKKQFCSPNMRLEFHEEEVRIGGEWRVTMAGPRLGPSGKQRLMALHA